MAKYVIDIPDEVKWIQYIQQTGHGTQNIKVKSVYNLTPYTEPDEDKSYGINRYKVIGLAFLKWLGNDVGDKLKSPDDVYRFLDKNCYNKDAVEQEVWEFAGEFYNADREVETLFGCDLDDICKKYTYSEAKAKYDAWRKQKDEIHEYDEIISEVPDNKAVIVRIDCWGQWHCINAGGSFMVEINQQDYWRKTGRSFPELGDVLKKMREE